MHKLGRFATQTFKPFCELTVRDKVKTDGNYFAEHQTSCSQKSFSFSIQLTVQPETIKAYSSIGKVITLNETVWVSTATFI